MVWGYAVCSIRTMIHYARFLSDVSKHIYAAVRPDLRYQKHLISVTFVSQDGVHKSLNSIDSSRLLPTLIFGTIY